MKIYFAEESLLLKSFQTVGHRLVSISSAADDRELLGALVKRRNHPCNFLFILLVDNQNKRGEKPGRDSGLKRVQEKRFPFRGIELLFLFQVRKQPCPFSGEEKDEATGIHIFLF